MTPADDISLRTARADLPAAIISGPKSTPAVAASVVGALAFAPASPSIAEPAPKPTPQAQPQTRAVATRAAAAVSTPVVAQPIGLRAAILAPRNPGGGGSRLDRSNFRQLTAPQEMARMTPAALAPAAPALRAAARTDLRETIFAPPTSIVTRFELDAASNIPAPGFAGAAVRPLQRLETASFTSSRRPN